MTGKGTEVPGTARNHPGRWRRSDGSPTDHDPVVPVADARAAANLIPDARLEVLPAGHVPQLGDPARVAALIAELARGRFAPGRRLL